MGEPQNLPHSLGGMSLVRLPKAQLSGRTLEEVVFATSPVCAGLSHPCCRPGVRMGMCHMPRT